MITVNDSNHVSIGGVLQLERLAEQVLSLHDPELGLSTTLCRTLKDFAWDLLTHPETDTSEIYRRQNLLVFFINNPQLRNFFVQHEHIDTQTLLSQLSTLTADNAQSRTIKQEATEKISRRKEFVRDISNQELDLSFKIHYDGARLAKNTQMGFRAPPFRGTVELSSEGFNVIFTDLVLSTLIGLSSVMRRQTRDMECWGFYRPHDGYLQFQGRHYAPEFTGTVMEGQRTYGREDEILQHFRNCLQRAEIESTEINRFLRELRFFALAARTLTRKRQFVWPEVDSQGQCCLYGYYDGVSGQKDLEIIDEIPTEKPYRLNIRNPGTLGLVRAFLLAQSGLPVEAIQATIHPTKSIIREGHQILLSFSS